MANKLKETDIHTDIYTDGLPLVVLSAGFAAKNRKGKKSENYDLLEKT